MAAGKLGKAGSVAEVTTISVSLASNAVAGRTLVSACVVDWPVTYSVNTGDGWRILLQESVSSGFDGVTTVMAVLERAYGGGDRRDTCVWSWDETDTCAAVIVELDDDFSAGLQIATASGDSGGLSRSCSCGSTTARGAGTAIAVVGVSDVNNWDASGTSGPCATWSSSFTEMTGGYFHDGREDSGGGIATKASTNSATIATTATAADPSATTSMAAGVIGVFGAADAATLSVYDGSRWSASPLNVYDGRSWTAAAGLTVAR